jgi:hypothetical protein
VDVCRNERRRDGVLDRMLGLYSAAKPIWSAWRERVHGPCATGHRPISRAALESGDSVGDRAYGRLRAAALVELPAECSRHSTFRKRVLQHDLRGDRCVLLLPSFVAESRNLSVASRRAAVTKFGGISERKISSTLDLDFFRVGARIVRADRAEARLPNTHDDTAVA